MRIQPTFYALGNLEDNSYYAYKYLGCTYQTYLTILIDVINLSNKKLWSNIQN